MRSSSSSLSKNPTKAWTKVSFNLLHESGHDDGLCQVHPVSLSLCFLSGHPLLHMQCLGDPISHPFAPCVIFSSSHMACPSSFLLLYYFSVVLILGHSFTCVYTFLFFKDITFFFFCELNLLFINLFSCILYIIISWNSKSIWSIKNN